MRAPVPVVGYLPQSVAGMVGNGFHGINLDLDSVVRSSDRRPNYPLGDRSMDCGTFREDGCDTTFRKEPPIAHMDTGRIPDNHRLVNAAERDSSWSSAGYQKRIEEGENWQIEIP
jgi:hypothetical protein